MYSGVCIDENSEKVWSCQRAELRRAEARSSEVETRKMDGRAAVVVVVETFASHLHSYLKYESEGRIHGMFVCIIVLFIHC